MYINILNYRKRRYLWLSLVLLLLCLAVYFSQSPLLPPNGGSWQGYFLGGVGLAIILWLTLLGIRKRSYNTELGTLQGWTSGHVYLGTILPVVATLHCAFQFGYNVHTLAYVLMMVVIVSGFYGLYAYLRFPGLQVSNRADQAFEERLKSLDDIDETAMDVARHCDPDVQTALGSSIERTSLGGSLLDQLLERDRSQLQLPGTDGSMALQGNAAQQVISDYIAAKIPATSKAGEAQRLQELLSHVGRRQEILRRLRRELALQIRLRLWLCFHVPLSIALLVAMAIHIFTVFFYW